MDRNQYVVQSLLDLSIFQMSELFKEKEKKVQQNFLTSFLWLLMVEKFKQCEVSFYQLTVSEMTCTLQILRKILEVGRAQLSHAI